MKETNKKIKAFTLAETLITLTIVGVLMIFCARNATRLSLDSDLAKFKKAYTGIELTVNYLSNDELIYGTSSGFKDTEAVTIKNVGEIIGQNGITKFRDAFKYYMHFVEDKINCPIYMGESSSGCFKTDYGVVFGIPDTDFIKKGVINIKDVNDNDVVAAPITFYTNYRQGQNVDDNAFVAAITYDGKIYFQQTDKADCSDKKSKQMQCKIKKYVQATTIKSRTSKE